MRSALARLNELLNACTMAGSLESKVCELIETVRVLNSQCHRLTALCESIASRLNELPTQPTGLLTYQDVAKHLGVSMRTVTRLVDQRKLRAVRVGHRTVRFRPVDVERCKAKLAGE